MPFNGSGVFSIVNTFVPNTTILSASVNGNFSDIATGLSDCLTRDGQAGMTAALKAISGSAGAPSITFTSDATTGIYLISAGNLGLTSGGILGFTLNAAQVGVFAQSAEAKLFMVPDTADATTSSNINTLATSGTGAIAVGSTTNWATAGYLICNNEVMSYTVASAAGLTINARGQLGTTNITQATGSTLTQILSGISKSDFLLPVRATASRPSSPVPGEFGFNSGNSLPEVYNGSVWISTAQPQVTPQGYLSTIAGTPIVTSDSTSQSTVYYNPYNGNQIPIPAAGVFSTTTFSTSAIALGSSQTTAGIYDIYAYSSGGVVSFGVSPSWSAGSGGSITPGSCARGTGAGGTQLTFTNGLYVNATSMTLLGIATAASTASIATASALYVGSIYIGATAGTVNLHRTFGLNRQWGIWNAYNRVPVYLKAGDGTASWTYATATIRQSNASAGNNLSIFSGLAEDTYDLSMVQEINPQTGSGQLAVSYGIGFNSTSAFTGMPLTMRQDTGNVANSRVTPGAFYLSPPLLGINTINACESGNTNSPTFYGTEPNMQLLAKWRA